MQREKNGLLFEERVCTNLAMKLENKQRAEIYMQHYFEWL